MPKLLAELSLYPLDNHYIPPIKDFIERLNQYPDLYIKTSATNTLVMGEHQHVMEVISKELAITHALTDQAILVCKFLKCPADFVEN
jgi:uncharacterized protein YqgV (UPF0045/DUF77 family)